MWKDQLFNTTLIIIISLFLLILMFLYALKTIKAYHREYGCLEQDLLKFYLLDELTGIHNRRGFLTLAEQQRKIASRKKTHFLLLYCDLDDLKEINDTMGHKAGDLALIQTAEILKSSFRDSDIIGRIGGDEFIVLMVDTEKQGPGLLIDRVRKVMHKLNSDGSFPCKLSLSIGYAEHDPESPATLEELIDQADAHMYEQKRRKQRL